MILKFGLIVLVFSVSFCNSQKEQTSQRKVYYFHFGCCFTGDSITAIAKNKVVFSGHVLTDDNIGKDKRNVFTIDPEASNADSVEIVMVQKNRRIMVPISKRETHRFVEINYYRDSLYHYESDRLMK